MGEGRREGAGRPAPTAPSPPPVKVVHSLRKEKNLLGKHAGKGGSRGRAVGHALGNERLLAAAVAVGLAVDAQARRRQLEVARRAPKAGCEREREKTTNTAAPPRVPLWNVEPKASTISPWRGWLHFAQLVPWFLTMTCAPPPAALLAWFTRTGTALARTL
mgnify:CR=1 FL=1